MQIHHVKECENIHDIAREYGVSPIKIAENNDIEIKSRLPVGRELLILTPSRTYNVKSGDSLDMIAKRFNTTTNALLRLNPELMGYEKLYNGQLLTIKDSTVSHGAISVNGYLYTGTPKEKLICALPHLSFVTVCSAVYKGGKVHNIFSPDDIVSLISSRRKTPLLRIYLSEMPSASGEKDFANSIGILAASGRFSGVALAGLNSVCDDKDRLKSLVFCTRKALMENDLLLFCEGDAESDTSYMEYSDAGVLRYDKLHKDEIPTFEEGEERVLEEFANDNESSRAFVELSGFAHSGDRYFEKNDALRITDRKKGAIVNDAERKIQVATYGKHKKKQIVFESLENTKAKLELVSELGFMGVSFDIGRVCMSDLMTVAGMFDLISYPIMIPKQSSKYPVKKCNP